MLPYVVLFLFMLIWVFFGLGIWSYKSSIKGYNQILEMQGRIEKLADLACLNFRYQMNNIIRQELLDFSGFYGRLNTISLLLARLLDKLDEGEKNEKKIE